MQFSLETPSRRVRFHEVDDETSSVAGDTCSVDGSSRDALGEPTGGVPCFELEEDPSFWKENNVQVVIRIRPLSNSEISLQGHKLCVRQNSAQSITWIGHPESRFTFDHVAGEHISQEKLFRVAGVPMVDNCVAGYNSCMFAYGQTGSGKTHTMLGDIEGGTRRHSVNAGMTPRVFEYLFSRIQKEKEARRDEKLQFVCKCSFLEIYNEQILDLLDPSATNLMIREDAKKGVHVENIREFEVSSARDAIQQLVQGAANRKVAATNMNRASSRSHSVFTCIIESKWESQGVTHHRFARLNLVDLAGSERQKSSGAEGERLKEATNINKSLSTLGLVIMNLVSVSNKKSLHVPYRDSKLTFLLQDSLGGNSKTIIVANISPSNCCTLETLSTLKFAQRAKFIRNNAIINEDASGDVITMRLQIQQLKKEVNRLRSLVNGGLGNQDDANVIGNPGSPGSSFKWNDGQGSFSPLTFDKKSSQQKDYEVSLVAAFRREQDKDKALQALMLEKEAAEQLANQRTEEVQGLKMRLRFREEGIKRLEAVASGKLAAETYLLHEKEELVKEIEVLRGQVDRSRQATRFAVENLQLKEELRRLQSFVEEGEREMMNQQITFLQEKLLEALDWKLMHEKDSDMIQGLSTSWDSSINEENEFLRLQIIQSQRELDALRKNLSCCLEAKEKLERRIDELSSKYNQESELNKNRNETPQPEISPQQPCLTSDDQFELRTMVEAIAAASQREQEAHAMAITLAKENEELREKLRILIDDNNKLIDLYEIAVANKATNESSVIQSKDLADSSTSFSGFPEEVHDHSNHETDVEMKNVDSMEQQLNEMHEDYEKLMNLYEQAMQERDEFKRMVNLNEQAMKERNDLKRMVNSSEHDNTDNRGSSCSQQLVKAGDEESLDRKTMEASDSQECFVKVPEANLSIVQTQLHKVQEAILDFVKLADSYGLVKDEGLELQNVVEEIEASDRDVHSKEKELASLRAWSSDIQERKNITDKEFSALKSALRNFPLNPSIEFWEEQEQHAEDKVRSCLEFVETKKQEITKLQSIKCDLDLSCLNGTTLDAQMREELSSFKMKLHEAENRRKESENVLLAIENIATRNAQKGAHLGKASELLKSEEERTKLVAEIKHIREKLAVLQKEIIGSKKRSDVLELEIAKLESEMQSGWVALEEVVTALHMAIVQKEMVFEMVKKGSAELGKVLCECQEMNFLSDLKEAEASLCLGELQLEREGLERLKAALKLKVKKINELLREAPPHSLIHTPGTEAKKTERMLLDTAHRDISEALSLLSARCQ